MTPEIIDLSKPIQYVPGAFVMKGKKLDINPQE